MRMVPEDQFSISDKAFQPRISRRENLQTLRDAGFTHIHFSHKWQELEPLSPGELAECKRDLAETGMAVLDVHGCHPTDRRYNLWSAPAADREQALNLFRHRLEITRELGGDAMVYHVPCHVESTPEVYRLFLDSLTEVEPLARSLGVSVALENHYNAIHDRATFEEAFERFQPDFLTFTLDPGHAQISGNLDWLIQTCTDRLQILHLNDNDGTSDRHWNPFFREGITDWPAIIRTLAASPYRKPIQLEVSWRQEKHPDYADFIQDAAAAARKIAREVNLLRQEVGT